VATNTTPEIILLSIKKDFLAELYLDNLSLKLYRYIFSIRLA